MKLNYLSLKFEKEICEKNVVFANDISEQAKEKQKEDANNS